MPIHTVHTILHLGQPSYVQLVALLDVQAKLTSYVKLASENAATQHIWPTVNSGSMEKEHEPVQAGLRKQLLSTESILFLKL